MAITYGTRTALANIDRFEGATDTQAYTFGEIDNSSGLHAYNIHMKLKISASATAGSYDVYLVESQDGTEWTDDIDPTVDTGDVAGKRVDARWVHSASTVYDGTDRTHAEIHFTVPGTATAQYFGFVVVNNSNQTAPATASDHDGDSQSYTIA